MIIWIIGLSGAGKSVLSEQVYQLCKKQIPDVVLIDGDVVREIFGNDLGHTKEDRWKNALRISGLCKFLDSQGIHVICAVLSLFPESQRWNRVNYSDYYQVYIKTPFACLIERDGKQLYKNALTGEIKNVVGVDIDFPDPVDTDLVIDNSAGVSELLAHAARIAAIIVQKANKDSSCAEL